MKEAGWRESLPSGDHQDSALAARTQWPCGMGAVDQSASGGAGPGEERVRWAQRPCWVHCGAGWTWGSDEFTAGPGKSDTHGELLCGKDGCGGRLPGGPGQGGRGARGLSVSCEVLGPRTEYTG